MHFYVFEDSAVRALEPLTLTRPAFELRCGATTLLDRQIRAAGSSQARFVVRPELNRLCRVNYPDRRFEPRKNGQDVTLLINARWIPNEEPFDRSTPRVGLVDDEIAYIVLSGTHVPEPSFDTIAEWTADWKQRLPSCPAGGILLRYPWDLIEHNAALLCRDGNWFQKTLQRRRDTLDITVLGPPHQLVVADGAVIEPQVVVDTRQGPVLIDRGAEVQSFSRLQGPCYIGEGSKIIGARVRGGTIGPDCRIGGEVEASIFHGHCNKYHDGFIGHSYLGEWVNIAAGTQVSDLRNDYAPIKMSVAGERLCTGQTKLGVFMGDHSKTGLGALLNSGSHFGAFCNLLPSGTYLPRVVPSFCQVRNGSVHECTKLQQLLQTAALVMNRRGLQMTDSQIDLYLSLYDQTARQRREAVYGLNHITDNSFPPDGPGAWTSVLVGASAAM